MAAQDSEHEYVLLHRTGRDDHNAKISIETLDEPGIGGAYYAYVLTLMGNDVQKISEMLSFHNPREGEGYNGVSDAAVLAVVLHRLECFQEGPLACGEYGKAAANVREAIAALHRHDQIVFQPPVHQSVKSRSAMEQTNVTGTPRLQYVEEVGKLFCGNSIFTKDQLNQWNTWSDVTDLVVRFQPELTTEEMAVLEKLAAAGSRNSRSGLSELKQAVAHLRPGRV